jgi:hypothetical protein
MLQMAPTVKDPDLAQHEVTYHRFVRAFLTAVVMVPFFLAFVLYWTQ